MMIPVPDVMAEIGHNKKQIKTMISKSVQRAKMKRDAQSGVSFRFRYGMEFALPTGGL